MLAILPLQRSLSKPVSPGQFSEVCGLLIGCVLLSHVHLTGGEISSRRSHDEDQHDEDQYDEDQYDGIDK